VLQKDIAKENVNIKIDDQDQIIEYSIPNIV
jgi:hypothetical protein